MSLFQTNKIICIKLDLSQNCPVPLDNLRGYLGHSICSDRDSPIGVRYVVHDFSIVFHQNDFVK